MTPERFAECLASLRWTTIELTSALQCQLSWVEAMESGHAEIPEDLARWLESLAKCHEAAGIPTRYRGLADFDTRRARIGDA
ncbi:hypothetical protein [Sinorhizobium fredii]|uniref:hypothetical protein n=1 Tax=Rhizobium fredii TaxID=380 RepID=UPI0004B41EBF|nr:hypothetical protein [Sinorhizobium fredii]ASY72849.1 hypothetical protein SF83666_b62000 [Sinorhizobium fredii CCBAU 83666]MQW96250.1 hypothetical protein [Sinorhizobium fredii]UTY45899.1 hypothetical protein EPK84_02820 [Sinorhizobium fredii]